MKKNRRTEHEDRNECGKEEWRAADKAEREKRRLEGKSEVECD